MKNERIGIYIEQLNDMYGCLLTEKQRQALRLYYDCDISLNEIAEQWGVTRQAVRDLVERSAGILTDFEEKLHLLDKKAELKKLSSEIQSELKNDELIRRLQKFTEEF